MKKLTITVTLVATMIGGVFTLVNKQTNTIPDVPTVMVIVTQSTTAARLRSIMTDLEGKEVYVYANTNTKPAVKAELKKQTNITEGFWSPDNSARVEKGRNILKTLKGIDGDVAVIQI